MTVILIDLSGTLKAQEFLSLGQRPRSPRPFHSGSPEGATQLRRPLRTTGFRPFRADTKSFTEPGALPRAEESCALGARRTRTWQKKAQSRVAGCRTTSVIAALAMFLLTPSAVSAHMSSSTYSEVKLDPHSVRYTIEIGALELCELMVMRPCQRLSQERIRDEEKTLGTFIASRVTVSNNGRGCPASGAKLTPVPLERGHNAARAELTYMCERRIQDVAITYDLFFEEDPRHQSFAKIEDGKSVHQHLFRASNKTWRLSRDVPVWQSMCDYAVLGVEHIFTGYDHILFLLALLLVAGMDGRTGAPRGFSRGLVYTIKIVTAFTVAHSITLIVAALGWISLPVRLVESAIALSIAYVAVENIISREPRFRWLLTFGFGLVHGLGFASVLGEIGLPRRGLVASLLSFNVGVEIGQIAIVAVLFPVLHLLASRSAGGWYRRAVLIGGSCVIVAFAVFWFVQRATGMELLGGRLGG